MTQAFLPLIRAGKGRLVNVGSIGGRLVLPLHGAYSASKFAMEAVTDAFRLELRQWGIHVSLVDPGGSASAIFGKTSPRSTTWSGVCTTAGSTSTTTTSRPCARSSRRRRTRPRPPTRSRRRCASALTAKRPKTRYLAGKDARAVAVMAKALPDHLKDLAVAHEADLPDPD